MITRSNHIHLEGKLLWDMVTISTVLKCIAFTGQKNCSRNGLTVTMLYFTVGVIIEVPCSPQQMNMFFSVKKNNALCWPVHFSFTNALSIPHRGGGGKSWWRARSGMQAICVTNLCCSLHCLLKFLSLPTHSRTHGDPSGII